MEADHHHETNKAAAISEFGEIRNHLSAAANAEIAIGGRRLPPKERDDRMEVSPWYHGDALSNLPTLLLAVRSFFRAVGSQLAKRPR